MNADTRVYRTEPETRLYPWQSAPSTLDQALEAANDDPSLTMLGRMLLDLPMVSHIMVDGDDEDWRPTAISVCFADDHGSGTGEIIMLMKRAGWEPTHACFSRERITFEEVDHA